MIPDTLSSVSNDEEGRYRQGDSDHDQAADINLYNQLSSIDFVNFVNTTSESKLTLKCGVNSYDEIELNEALQYEIPIENFETSDVFILFLDIISKAIFDANVIDLSITLQQHIPPAVGLQDNQTSNYEDLRYNIKFKPKQNNDRYSFCLTAAQGFSTGTYLLKVSAKLRLQQNNLHSNPQENLGPITHVPIKTRYDVEKIVQTTSVLPRETLSGIVHPLSFTFYKYIHTDSSTGFEIEIRTQLGLDPTCSSSSLHLYVTNEYDGLVAITPSTALWSTTQSHGINPRVQSLCIHPSDALIKNGSVYLIGVFDPYSRHTLQHGSSVDSEANTIEPSTQFHIQVRSIPSGLCKNLSWLPNQCIHLSISPQKDTKQSHVSHYFCIDTTASTNNEKLILSIHPKIRNSSAELTPSISAGNESQHPVPHHPRVKNNDEIEYTKTFFTSGRFVPRPNHLLASPGMPDNTNVIDNVYQTSQKSDVFIPIVYISRNCPFPGPHNFDFKAAGDDGLITISIPSRSKLIGDDVDLGTLDSTNKYIYINLTSLDLSDYLEHFDVLTKLPNCNSTNKSSYTDNSESSAPHCAFQADYDIVTTIEPISAEVLPAAHKLRYSAFCKIFHGLDGEYASHNDRKNLNLESNNNYIYSESSYASIISLLSISGSRDGQVFYDLGSGAGNVVLAVIFSGIKFTKVIGIEYLPHLCKYGKIALQRFQCILQGENYITKPQGTTDRRGSVDSDNTVEPGTSATTAASTVKTLTPQEVEAVAQLNVSLPLAEIREGDFLCMDWSDGDVLFMSNLSWSEKQLQTVVRKCIALKAGAIVFTIKLFPGWNDVFDLVYSYPFSTTVTLTSTTVNILKKRSSILFG